MIPLASILGPSLAGKLLGSKWFLPMLRIGLVLLVVAALWLAYTQWRDSIFAAGVAQERAAWQKLDLETKLANERVQNERLRGALILSTKNIATNERLKEMWSDISGRLADRNRALVRAREVPLAQLFEAGPDPCSVYVRDDTFIRMHNASGTLTGAAPP